ncbi:MAG TPA: hypothetical protein VKT70_13345 [Stellaceae bacterium]|nr:hypothetical protein [Stellaceae bacterium]
MPRDNMHVPRCWLTTSGLSDKVALKILSFAQLPRGWRYGAGGPIPLDMIERGLAWNIILRSYCFADIDAFAGVEGEILLTALHAPHDIEVILETDGTFTVAHDLDGRQVSYLPHRGKEEVDKALADIMRDSWAGSDYFTRVNLMSSAGDLRVWPSETPLVTGAGVYLSSTNNALSPPAQHYAPILENIIQLSPVNHLYFGAFQAPPSRQSIA